MNMEILIRSGRIVDPGNPSHRRVADLAIAGDRIIAPDSLVGTPRVIDARGFMVTAAAIDPSAYLTFPGSWMLRAAGLLPSLPELSRRYLSRGFGLVQEAFIPLSMLPMVGLRHLLLGGLQNPISVGLPIYELATCLAQGDATGASALCRNIPTRTFFLPEPAVRHRLDVYRHRDRTAQELFGFLEAESILGEARLHLPFDHVGADELPICPSWVHLQRVPAGNPALYEISWPEGVSMDLALDWSSADVEIQWLPPDQVAGRWAWDVGYRLILTAQNRPGQNFTTHQPTLVWLRDRLHPSASLTSRYASLALVEPWEDFVQAVMEATSVDTWLIMTRVNAARAVGLSDVGNLTIGSRATLALYSEPLDDTPKEWARSMSRCVMVMVDGCPVFVDSMMRDCLARGGLGETFGPARSGLLHGTVVEGGKEGFTSLEDAMSLRVETLMKMLQELQSP